MTHQDEDQTRDMLGRHPYRSRSLELFGYPLKDVMIILGIVFALGGGWYQLQFFTEKLTGIALHLEKMEKQSETTRIERDAQLKDLENRVNRGEVERAAQTQKLENLNDLLRDIRSLMRDSKKAQGESPY